MIRSIKIVDIFYTTALFIIAAFITAFILDKYVFPKINKEDEMEKSIYLHIFEVIIIIGLLASIAYIVRNLIELIPYPLNGIYGYDHQRLKELKAAGGIYLVFCVLFSSFVQDKIQIIKEKFKEFKKI